MYAIRSYYGYDVDSDKSGNIWIATWDGVYSDLNGGLDKIEGPTPPIARVVAADEGVYALGPYGVWFYQGNQCVKKNYRTAKSMRAAVSDGKGGLWIGSRITSYNVCYTKLLR